MAEKVIRCFVISAFGTKPLLLRDDDPPREADFDSIYDDLKPILEEYGGDHEGMKVIVERADFSKGGQITPEIYRNLFEYELVIAEVSSISQNVFYELGVRFALRASATILLAIEGTILPFDLKDERKIIYQYRPGGLRQKKRDIYEMIRARLDGALHSPVFSILPDLRVLSQGNLDQLQESLRNQNRELEKRLQMVQTDEKSLELVKKAESLLDKTGLRREDLIKATSYLQQACELSPDNYQVTLKYGKQLSRIEDFSEAIRVLTQAVNIISAPGGLPRAEPYRERALAYRRRASATNSEDDYRAAIDDYNRALQIEPDDVETLARLGNLYRRQVEISSAIECFKRGLALDQSSTYCLIGELVLRVLGVKMRQTMDTNEWLDFEFRARFLLTQAENQLGDVNDSTDDYWRLMNRAELSLIADQRDIALQYYERAANVSSNPADLQGPIDNLTFIQNIFPLPGTQEAIDVLRQHHSRLSIYRN
jgi:tetratricopeptide (TPR) repeat protein